MTYEILEYSTTSVDFTPHDSRWIPHSARFVVLGETAKSTGRLGVFKLSDSGVTSVCETERDSGLKCCTFGSHTLPERFIATGSLSGELETWDLEHASEPRSSFKAHRGAVNAIDGSGGGTHGIGALEIVTGGRDGTVKVWDTRQESAVAIFKSVSASTCECWCVAFGNSFDENERCVLAGYENGDVKMFDLRVGTVRYETNIANGVCSVEFDRKDITMNKFVATCLESQFVVFDARTQHPDDGFASVTQNSSVKTTIWGVRHLPQDREVFATLLGDGSVALYRYEYPVKRQRLCPAGKPQGVAGSAKRISSTSLASQPINSWDWHAEKTGLAVCSGFDQRVRVVVMTN